MTKICLCGAELTEADRMGSKYACSACGAVIAPDGSDGSTFNDKRTPSSSVALPHGHRRAPEPVRGGGIKGVTFVIFGCLAGLATLAFVALFGSEGSYDALRDTMRIIMLGTAFTLVLFVYGCGRVAAEKGYSRAWGLLGVTGLIGFVVLLFFPKLPGAEED